MTRLRWTPEAASDLQHIREYLEERRPHLAQRTVIRLYEKIRSLKTTPNVGRIGRIDGTRELVHSPLPYITVYRVKENAVEVLHIYHMSQDWS